MCTYSHVYVYGGEEPRVFYNRASMNPPSALALVATSGAALAGMAGAVAYAAMYPESQVFGRTMVSPPEPGQFALTFDDGPNPAATPRLLEVLARHKVRATFFLIGDFVLREPGLAREIAAAGHAIGNHTMTHPFLPRRSAARIFEEVTRCNEALEQTLGQKVDLFRPPHGGRSPAVFRATKALGLEVVQWNLIVGDWSAHSAATILSRVEKGIARNRRRGRGTNVVLHDGGQAGQPRIKTVEAVAQLLDRLAPETEFVVP
jgi:peptidoglycan/xylan/chitin deacetylase (PgdA/CDA1 family)